MNKQKIENNDLENVSGGVKKAPNGTFWLTEKHVNKLKSHGFRVANRGLTGWKGIADGYLKSNSSDDEDLATYQVNDPNDNKVRSVKTLNSILEND